MIGRPEDDGVIVFWHAPRRKTFAYVGWVAGFSIIAGLLHGAWVDGVGVDAD